MLAETHRLIFAVIVLSILSTSHQEDLPLHKNIIKHDKLIHDYANKTRARKYTHDNSSTLQEDTIRNISNRIDNGIAQHFNSKNEQESLQAQSAGSSEGEIKGKSGGGSTEDDDEDKKTLAQQVAEGKYGLIHTELFQTPPKRPGILTYKINPEVPKDNVNNLGGLDAEEIWLAENHLLVLAGGAYSNRGQNWPPIDDYVAPRRQVKIPSNPKVPPPFPIQLTENGPIELVKGVNGSLPRPLPFFPPSAADLNVTGMFPFFPPPPPGFPPGNFPPGGGPPLPFQLPNGSIPQLPPFPPGFRGPPPGIPFPPPVNWTDLIDEDDPSIYYPPPYDFYFPKDNSSYVPAGPLVPGIVLPPPPDFFAPYDNATKPPTKTKLVKGPVVKKVKYQPPKQFFDTPTLLPEIDNSLNTLTTPSKFMYRTSTEPPRLRTSTETLRNTKPSVQIINEYPPTDEITNEVTPSSGKKDDDWIPIPAPHPYYITGPAKPLKENVLVMMNIPNQETETQGYQYNTPNKPLKLPQHTNKYVSTKQNSISEFYNQNHLSNDNHVYADEPMGKQYRPVTRKPKMKAKSTVAPAQVFHVPVRTGGKSLQTTYYFYEDPLPEEDIGLTPPKPVKSVRPSTPPTEASILDFYIPKEPIHIKSKPISTINNYDSHQHLPPPSILDPYQLRQPTTTTLKPSLLDYFYFNGDKNGGYNFMVPDPGTLMTPKSTSRPIFEYSYTAPGYKDETKNTQPMEFYYNSYPSTVTTTRPTDFLFPYGNSIPTTPSTAIVQTEVYTTTPRPLTTAKPHYMSNYTPQSTTQRTPDRSNYERTSTQKPWRHETSRKPFQFSYTTPNPFYAFFTHHDESLVDDNTKKYFTLFGQKIKRPNLESTTPLNQVQHNPHSSEEHNYYDASKEDHYDDYSKERVKGNANSDETHYTSLENHNSNSQENVNYNSNNNYENNGYQNSQEHVNQLYNDYKSQENEYKSSSSASTEDPSFNYDNSNYKFKQSSFSAPFRQTTARPKAKLTYQQLPKTQSHIISLSNSFNVDSNSNNNNNNNNNKRPTLEYDYDYDYDKHPEPSLQDDTQVNYKKPYSKDYDAEWMPLSQQYKDHRQTGNDNNQFISYKLPGNGNGHFFFLTPQAVQLEELANAYLFPSNVESRSNFYNKRNTNRARRKPNASSSLSVTMEKQSNNIRKKSR